MSKLALISEQQVSGSLTIRSMDDLSRLSEMLAKSGFFDDCKSAAQAGVKVLAGLELGIPAFAAMSGIHLIKGKPALGANVMAAMIKRSGKYNYRVLEHTEQVCRIAFFEGKEEIGVSEFTATDAQRMGTQNMNKFPKNMLFARAISNGIKFHCPDLFLGAPVYTPEELGAEVDDDGRVTVTAEVMPSMSQFTANRLQGVQERTGFDRQRIADIARKMRLSLDGLSDASGSKVRDAVYAAWGAEQGVFNSPQHAWNSYKKLLEQIPDAGDDDIWTAWEADVSARLASADSVNEEDEEF